MSTVYNGGTYDLLHSGHLYAFRQLRDLAGPGGQVVIALNTDAFVEAFKGHPPVQAYEERAEILAACRYIDRVVPNSGGADSKPTLELVAPDILAAGHDWWSPDDSRYCAQMGLTPAWLEAHHIRLVYLDWLPGRSSTNIRQVARELQA